MDKTIKLAVGLALLLSLGACAVTSKPVTEAERGDRVATDLSMLFADIDPVTGVVTPSEAIARAIKYNIDQRVKMLEHAVSVRQLEVARVGLLPQITASAGYTSRSNQSGSSSISLLSGEQSLEPSTSQERDRRLADLTLAWNVLDFGVSYLTAKQRQDEIRITEQRRRRAVQNIVEDVIDAYWHAWSAQQLVGDMEQLLKQTDAAIRKSRELVANGTQRKREALEYQRTLLETRSQLWEIHERLSLARIRLARLMNLRPGTDFALVANHSMARPLPVAARLDQLEQLALNDRPELREEDYQVRISRLDVKKSLLRMFPGIEINAGTHYDSNDLLFNKSWSDVTAGISWNLFNFFLGRSTRKLNQARLLLAENRRMALSMAVMTQVRLAIQRYDLARHRFIAANELAEVNASLLRLTENSGPTRTEAAAIRSRATALVANMRKHLNYAETQTALARVFNSVGIDPLPTAVDSYEIAALSKAIENHWQQLGKRFLKQPAPVRPQTTGSDVSEVAARPTADALPAVPAQATAAQAPRKPKMILQWRYDIRRYDSSEGST